MKDLQLKEYTNNSVGYLLNLINIDQKDEEDETSLINKIQEFKNRIKVYDLIVQIKNIKELSTSTQNMLNQ